VSILLETNPEPGVCELVERARAIRSHLEESDKPLGMLIVDSLQSIRPAAQHRHHGGYIAWALKQLAEELHVPILVTSDLSAGLLPAPQPSPGGHPAAEAKLLRQMLPADPRVQHKQDPLQREAIIERLATRIPKPPRLARHSGSIRSHNPSGTSHGFALIETLPSLTTGADGLRYRRTGPFIR